MKTLSVIFVGALLLAGCNQTVANNGPDVTTGASATGRTYTTKMTYYGPGFHGRKTASGERFNKHAMTTAHKTLPFGTRLKVTNPKSGRSVVVRVNDRGPFRKGYSLDLSEGAARSIGISSGAVVVTELN